MIDGIDVSECEYLNACGDKIRCVLLQDDVCEINPNCESYNCYYKQLKRKEQENKHLTDLLNNALAEKEKYENAIDDIKGYVNRYWGCANYRQSKDILMIIKKAKENCNESKRFNNTIK